MDQRGVSCLVSNNQRSGRLTYSSNAVSPATTSETDKKCKKTSTGGVQPSVIKHDAGMVASWIWNGSVGLPLCVDTLPRCHVWSRKCDSQQASKPEHDCT